MKQMKFNKWIAGASIIGLFAFAVPAFACGYGNGYGMGGYGTGYGTSYGMGGNNMGYGMGYGRGYGMGYGRGYGYERTNENGSQREGSAMAQRSRNAEQTQDSANHSQYQQQQGESR